MEEVAQENKEAAEDTASKEWEAKKAVTLSVLADLQGMFLTRLEAVADTEQPGADTLRRFQFSQEALKIAEVSKMVSSAHVSTPKA